MLEHGGLEVKGAAVVHLESTSELMQVVAGASLQDGCRRPC